MAVTRAKREKTGPTATTTTSGFLYGGHDGEPEPMAPAPAPTSETGNGGGDSKPERQRTRLPEGWRPFAADFRFALDRGFTGPHIERLADAFTAHHTAKGDTSKDWSASWRLWVLRDLDLHGPADARQPVNV